jgi:hypothetical protein
MENPWLMLIVKWEDFSELPSTPILSHFTGPQFGPSILDTPCSLLDILLSSPSAQFDKKVQIIIQENNIQLVFFIIV